MLTCVCACVCTCACVWFVSLQEMLTDRVSEYKFKLSKAEQEMGTMEQNVSSGEYLVAACTHGSIRMYFLHLLTRPISPHVPPPPPD